MIGSVKCLVLLMFLDVIGLLRKKKWCGQEDSNFHEISPTATSTLRVYQFRHDRTSCQTGRGKPIAELPWLYQVSIRRLCEKFVLGLVA